MNKDHESGFLRDLLIDAQVIDRDLEHLQAESSGILHGKAASRDELPWHWPTGSRRLLAGLIVTAAASITLSASGRPAGEERRSLPVLVLDANTAPARVLGALPHVGPALVRHWTAAREIRPFDSLDDLEQRVRGLGPVNMARIAPHIRIERDSESVPEDSAGAGTIR